MSFKDMTPIVFQTSAAVRCVAILSMTLLANWTNAAEFVPLGMPPDDLNIPFHGEAEGTFACGVSDDGAVVNGGTVGRLKSMIWTEDSGWTPIGASIAELNPGPICSAFIAAGGISGDGSTVLGRTRADGVLGGFIHSLTEGSRVLPGDSSPMNLSFDGTIVAGRSVRGLPMRWTKDQGGVELGALHGGEGWASDLSSDGSVVVGVSHLPGTGIYEIFRWTENSGMVGTGLYAKNDPPASSADGSAIVGAANVYPDNGCFETSSCGNVDELAVRWTQASGAQFLGALDGSTNENGVDFSNAAAANHDASIIVGKSGWADRRRAFIWTDDFGMEDLQEALANRYDLGQELAGWNLLGATDITPNGRFISGAGINPDGLKEGWLVRLDTPFALSPLSDCVGDGVLSDADLMCVTTLFARDDVLHALNTLPGDIDGNGEVEFGDFLILSQNFGQDEASYAAGNINLTGGVDFEDFLILAGNFGKTSGDLVAVPEPTALVFVCAGSLGIGLIRRRLRVENADRKCRAQHAPEMKTDNLNSNDTTPVVFQGRLALPGMVILSMCLLASSTDAAEFFPLGFLRPSDDGSRAMGVSDDGSVVAGFSLGFGDERAMRWTENTGWSDLGNLPGFEEERYIMGAGLAFRAPDGISGNGSTFTGHVSLRDRFRPRAFVYTQADGMLELDGAQMAFDASYDGNVVVGWSDKPNDTAFRWTPEQGLVDLGSLYMKDSVATTSMATDVSADGSVVVGISVLAAANTSREEVFVWTDERGLVGTGVITAQTLPSVSADGSVVAISAATDENWNPEAFRWSEEAGALSLGFLPGTTNVNGIDASWATDVNRDGSIIVGQSGEGLVERGDNPAKAFIWTGQFGMEDLQQALIDRHGLGDELDEWELFRASDISPNGRFIVGDGFNPDGVQEGWLVRLDAPFVLSPLSDCNGDGVLNAVDLACVTTLGARNDVLEALNSLPGDVDGDGEVAFEDFLVLSENFGKEDPSYAAGNINLAGGIDFADFLILSGNFGKTAGDVVAVPEPSAFAFVCAGSLGIGLIRRRRRPDAS